MSSMSAPANWYPDPDGRGGLRYWDGFAWTEFRTPPAPPVRPPPGSGGPLPWKGAQLGRPAAGPGALADPGRRLGAQALDWLLVLPVFALLLLGTLLVAGPHFGPIFPTAQTTSSTTSAPPPGFLWVYLTVFGCAFVTGLVMLTYQTVATARYGRTLGKAWLRIRPLRVDGSTLGWGRSFGRAAISWLAWGIGWIGVLDPLWCLWDDRRQCVHDKVADSIVVNDPLEATGLPDA